MKEVQEELEVALSGTQGWITGKKTQKFEYRITELLIGYRN